MREELIFEGKMVLGSVNGQAVSFTNLKLVIKITLGPSITSYDLLCQFQVTKAQ